MFGNILSIFLGVTLLTSCVTREFYRQTAQAPWEELLIREVEVPVFQAPADCWFLSDRARSQVVAHLQKGTVNVASGTGLARLVGSISRAKRPAQYTSARRVLRASSASAGNVQQMTDPFVWEVDRLQESHIRLAVQLFAAQGEPLWRSDFEGVAADSRVVQIAWPGNDVMAPPSSALPPLDPALQRELDQEALDKAMRELLPLLGHSYRYRPIQ
ncbi:MAG: hypothetical protein VKN33_02660 [Candidatus Sericytochromatia bacterium]|nr:hypothetical protein [Candidatus Sericytochromatia bacterium]